MTRTIVLIVSAIFVFSAARGASAKSAYQVWTASSLEKVTRRAAAKPLEPIAISAARGEHEAYQIVLRAGRSGLKGVRVSASDLSSGRHRLPASIYAFHQAAYVYLPKLAEHYPDPLLPVREPLELSPGETVPIWASLVVPRDTKPGVYSGTITVTAEDASATSVQVSLKVYGFEMPAGPKITTAFGLWSLRYLEIGHGLPANSPEAVELHRKYYDFLLERGISTFNKVPGDIMSDEFARYVTDPRVTGFQIALDKDEQVMRKHLDRVRSLGAWDKSYFYFVDEPKNEKQYKDLMDGCEYLRKIDPKVNIVSPYYSNPEFAKDKTVYDLLKGCINIWCFVTNFYDEKAIDERRSAGDKIWNYVCCAPLRPYANFFVDFSPLEHRILLWQNYLYRVTGLLYWNTIYWDPTGTTDPWQDIASVKWINPEMYGDGSLLYPGKKVGIDGPVSSIRIECIRDSIEDYSYLWLLEQQVGREAVLTYVRKLTTAWNEFGRDPERFRSVRDEIATQIERGSKAKG